MNIILILSKKINLFGFRSSIFHKKVLSNTYKNVF